MPTFAVVDIETTGGNFYQDRIIEIAIVIHDGNQVISEHTALINPEKPILPFISRLTGISNNMVKKAPTFSQVAQELHDLLKGHVFVAHNVKFDYGFIKAAFKSVNIVFRAPHFCTVELSRIFFPNQQSYSLGKLSRSLGIEVSHRHRAFGDAAATATLLGKMCEADMGKVLSAVQTDELNQDYVPDRLNIEVLDTLPELVGVYSFHDEEGKTIYVSRAKNIREAVLSHFKVPVEQQKNALNAFIADVSYILSGSDILSVMLESQLIIEKHPRFNRFIKVPTYKWGLFRELDNNGYITYKSIALNKAGYAPLQRFTSQYKAEKYLSQLSSRLQVPPTLKQVYDPEKYNALAAVFLDHLTYPFENCLIVDQGRFEDEKAIIIVEKYQCIGVTYHSSFQSVDYEHVVSKMYPVTETPEIRRLLLQYIRKKKNKVKILEIAHMVQG